VFVCDTRVDWFHFISSTSPDFTQFAEKLDLWRTRNSYFDVIKVSQGVRAGSSYTKVALPIMHTDTSLRNLTLFLAWGTIKTGVARHIKQTFDIFRAEAPKIAAEIRSAAIIFSNKSP
jgi:hypothetical protein